MNICPLNYGAIDATECKDECENAEYLIPTDNNHAHQRNIKLKLLITIYHCFVFLVNPTMRFIQVDEATDVIFMILRGYFSS